VSAILESRERLYRTQLELLTRWPAVVTVGLSLPGGYSIYPWEELFAGALLSAKSVLDRTGVTVGEEMRLDTAAGPCSLLATEGDGRFIKAEMVFLEQSQPQGRLWDIDVMTSEGPIDRAALGLPPRKCLVCDSDAHLCRKLGAHAPQDVISAARKVLSGS